MGKKEENAEVGFESDERSDHQNVSERNMGSEEDGECENENADSHREKHGRSKLKEAIYTQK